MPFSRLRKCLELCEISQRWCSHHPEQWCNTSSIKKGDFWNYTPTPKFSVCHSKLGLIILFWFLDCDEQSPEAPNKLYRPCTILFGLLHGHLSHISRDLHRSADLKADLYKFATIIKSMFRGGPMQVFTPSGVWSHRTQHFYTKKFAGAIECMNDTAHVKSRVSIVRRTSSIEQSIEITSNKTHRKVTRR